MYFCIETVSNHSNGCSIDAHAYVYIVDVYIYVYVSGVDLAESRMIPVGVYH